MFHATTFTCGIAETCGFAFTGTAAGGCGQTRSRVVRKSAYSSSVIGTSERIADFRLQIADLRHRPETRLQICNRKSEICNLLHSPQSGDFCQPSATALATPRGDR